MSAARERYEFALANIREISAMIGYEQDKHAAAPATIFVLQAMPLGSSLPRGVISIQLR